MRVENSIYLEFININILRCKWKQILNSTERKKNIYIIFMDKQLFLSNSDKFIKVSLEGK